MRTELHERALPTGTVTFMFTDIEGSTRAVQRLGNERFSALLDEHHRVVRSAVTDGGGVDVSTEGDSFFAVFADPVAAADSAIRIQRDLKSLDWGDQEPLRVRIGLHTGSGVLGGDNYVGVDVHRASRIADAAHGGQVVLSEVTASLVEDRLEEGVSASPLGRYRLSGFAEPASLHQLTAATMQREFPPLRASPVESRLPSPLTEFVGRKDEILLGLEILGGNRLLTLTGPGGTGKTRLSLEIARQAEADFPGGAYFVPLASLNDPSLVAMSILDALKLKTAGGVDPLEHISRFVDERAILLILDNFEQLFDGASLVSRLISNSPRLSVIVTSRTPLRVAGERELPVPPLEVPGEGMGVSGASHTEGIQLFTNRAKAVRPDFAVTDENVATVTAIVRALDGLPLAIELAASRLRSLTPDLVLDRLGNKLLKSQSADLPARQQTIVNAIGWSYDLLDEQHKVFFEKLSVFGGTFGLDEVELVCGDDPDPLDGLSELVEQSLLRQTASAGQPRFRMLTVIREFAYAALVARGADRDLLDRHASVYQDLATRSDAEILTSKQQHWLDRLSEEHDNLRSAFEHAVDIGDASTALEIAGSLWRFWQIRGHLVEGRQRLQTALALPTTGKELERARSLTGLGGILYWLGMWEETLSPYRDALDLFRRFGNDDQIAEALYNLSFALAHAGEYDRAESMLQESLELNERIGRSIGVGRAYWGLGDLAVYRGDWAGVVEPVERAIEEFSALDAPFDLGWAWFMLGYSRVRLSETERARYPLGKALEIFATVGDLSALALILETIAFLLLIDDEEAKAARVIGAAHRLRTDTGVAIGDIELNQYPELNEFLERMDEVTKAAYDEGYNADLDGVVDVAFAILS